MVKNLIFDVGGVLLGYDWLGIFKGTKFNIEEVAKIGDEVFGTELWKQMDLGMVTEAEAAEQYKKMMPNESEMIDFLFEHYKDIDVPRPEVYEIVGKLKEKGMKIFILSNYSKEFYRDHYKDIAFIDELDGMVVSCDVHLLKPDRRIYECLLERYALKAEECMFFDDLEENVEAAVKLGIKGYRVKTEEDLKEELKKLL